MAASIIFLSAVTRRVFPVEILRSSDAAPVSAMGIVLIHRPFVLPRFVVVVIC